MPRVIRNCFFDLIENTPIEMVYQEKLHLDGATRAGVMLYRRYPQKFEN